MRYGKDHEQLVGMTPEQIVKLQDAEPDVVEAAKELISHKRHIVERNNYNREHDRRTESIPTFTYLSMELYTRTSLWSTILDGTLQLKMVSCRRGRMQGAANFTRKSKVSRTKLILWFINSRGNVGASASDIQRFICELNGIDYDRFEWLVDFRAEAKFRDTGKRIWAAPGQTYEEAMRTHGGEYNATRRDMVTVDEREPRQGPVRVYKRRVNRGYYCDLLYKSQSKWDSKSSTLKYEPSFLAKYCDDRKEGRYVMYTLNDAGRKHMMTEKPLPEEPPADPVLPAPPAARRFTRLEEHV